MFIVVSVYFVIDSVRKLSDTPSYINKKLIFAYRIIFRDHTRFVNREFIVVHVNIVFCVLASSDATPENGALSLHVAKG
jgi:hypothetical protein